MIRLLLALFAIQAGFHAFTASLPLALADAGIPDPTIGLIVGTAAVVQVPAAFASGALLDRFGGLRLLVAGAAAYVLAAGVIALAGDPQPSEPLPYLLARLLQGLGIAAVLPAGLSMVPRLVARSRQGVALATAGSANNLTLAVFPPVSVAVLAAGSLVGVAALAAVSAIVGVLLVTVAPLALRAADGPEVGERLARRRLGFAFRRSWLPPVVALLLFVTHWGVVTAYLPQRAEAAGADIGLFFTADAIAILLLRIPSGWLVDHARPWLVILAGFAITAAALSLLLLPPTTPLLVLTGLLTGGAGALVLTPLLLEVSQRSTDADRGSAFALYSGALAGALAVGSIGGAPIVAAAGFDAALVASIGMLAAGVVVVAADPAIRRRPTPRSRKVATLDPTP